VAAIVGTVLVIAVGAIVAQFVLAGDDDDGADVVAEAVARLEPSLDRLSATAQRTQARSPASFVALRSAAERAVDDLDDEEDRLQALETDVRDQPVVAAFEDAVETTRQLAESLSLPGQRPAVIAGLASEQKSAVDEAIGPELPVIEARQVVASLRRRRAAVAVAASSSQSSEAAATTASPSPVALPDFTVRNAFGYQARIPTGGGWGAPADSQPNSRLYRTNLRGPGGLFLIIDYTPNDEAMFGGDYESQIEVGQTAFGTATEYVFRGGSLPECQRATCVDYIINDPVSSQGFAVLAGGGDLATVKEIARTVMESLTPEA
jgi:hypothetical protein